jgi:hypothetical protein
VVQRNGGEVVANPMSHCFVIVGDKRTMQTKSLIDAGKNDVLSFQYIVDSVNGQLGNEDGNPNPSHFLGYTKETRSLFSGMFDEFGDSYTDDVDELQIRAIFSRLGDTIASLKRKKESNGAGKKAKKSKKIDEDVELDGRADRTLQLSKELESQNWRQIIRNNVLEDSDYAMMLDDSPWNVFWRSNTVLVSSIMRSFVLLFLLLFLLLYLIIHLYIY